ncbi:MAG: hypothetical protein ABJJ53_02055 [Sulfitobacter sp.]
MSFTDTYREERLISRRSRARKARIAGGVIGFGLTACFVVALRTEPQLRAVVDELALKAMGLPRAEETAAAQTVEIDALGATSAQEAPVASTMPQSRVKINRPGSG